MNMNMPPMERMPTPVASAARYRTATGVIEAATPSLSRRKFPASSDRSTAMSALGPEGSALRNDRRSIPRSRRCAKRAEAARGASASEARSGCARRRAGAAEAWTSARKHVEASQEALGRDERAPPPCSRRSTRRKRGSPTQRSSRRRTASCFRATSSQVKRSLRIRASAFLFAPTGRCRVKASLPGF